MKNKEKPLVITDLDGTLVNVLDELLAQLAIDYAVALTPEDHVEYDVAKSFYPHLDKEFASREAFEAYLLDSWKDGTIYDEARPYWSLHRAYQLALKAEAIDLVAYTNRPVVEQVQDATENWLGTWNYGEIACHFARSYDDGKLGAILAADIVDREVWVVEDDVETAQALLKILPELQIFIVDRPWTRNAWKASGEMMPGGIEGALLGLVAPPPPSPPDRLFEHRKVR